MKSFVRQEQAVEIQRFFDIDTDDPQEVEALKDLLRSLFAPGQALFFSGIREQSFTPAEERAVLRRYVPAYCQQYGRYAVVGGVDQERFHGCGALPFNEATLAFIFRLWDYFLHLTVFAPKPAFTWPDFVATKGLFFQKTTPPLGSLHANVLDVLLEKDADGTLLQVSRRV
jgi:hypothetical protein